MKKEKIICFDIETTGLNPFEDEILQLSIVDGCGNVLFDELTKPEHHSEWEEAAAINGITPETVADKQPISHWLPTLQKIFDDAELIVGYNCDGFDLAFMEQAGLTVDAPTFDVMLEFAPIYGDYDERRGDYRWQKLTTCAMYYNYKGQNWHNSLADTMATLHCYYGVLHDQHIIVTEHSVTALTEYERIPDPTINADEMYAYGYTWEGMYPLGQEVAEWMYSQEILVLQLFPDETEKGVESIEELREHAQNGGIFGIEKEHWNIILDARAREAFKAIQTDIATKEALFEEQLLHGVGDQYGIYQLIPTDENAAIMFESYGWINAHNIQIDRKNYQLVYTAPLDPKMTLDGIYQKFNTDLPRDYKGRSLSVSDIIVLKQDGKLSTHYVDSIGFREVAVFSNDTKAQICEPPKEKKGSVRL